MLFYQEKVMFAK